MVKQSVLSVPKGAADARPAAPSLLDVVKHVRDTKSLFSMYVHPASQKCDRC